jgi:Mlc titration factor MtfA (ptsG expression regulator)
MSFSFRPSRQLAGGEEFMQPETLGTHAERRRNGLAFTGAAVAVAVAAILAVGLRDFGIPLWLTLPSALGLGWVVFRFMTGPSRRRRQILAQPFPPEWEAVLQENVVFYRSLDPESRIRFQRELQVFLGEKRITGIKTTVDATTLVLAGASAIIPIFGYQEWEWDQISEVLVYPGRFGPDFEIEGGDDRNTLGVVGTGALNRVMILSKPDLLQGFRNPADKRNVGLHEFAHLVDKSDGTIDGVPGVGLDRRSIGPWIELIRRKMNEIEAGDSDLNPYALTNEAEFFAVATEYLFERPKLMQQKHPELFGFMQEIFKQDLVSRLGAMGRERRRGPQRFGRNSPCPCGSGKKFKKCCLVFP